MFTKFIVLLTAVCCTSNGSPLDPWTPEYNSNFFLNNRILGGEDAPEGYGRHMAALVFGHSWTAFVCGGSIVTGRHILTAAHCIDVFLTWDLQLMPSFRGLIGSTKWQKGTNVKFTDYVMHEKWDWDTIKYDIGVLTVAEDIQPSDSVVFMPLKFDWVDGGQKSYVTGWGLREDMFQPSDKLQLLYVNTLNHSQCQEGILKAIELWGPAPAIRYDIEICTLHSPGHGMCNGDSGSALVEKATQKQIGIVSWGFPCALGAPDVYVRNSGFKEFLLNATENRIQKDTI